MTTITTAESRLPVPESDAWAYARVLYDIHQLQRREGTHPKRTADVLACKFVFGTRPALQSEKFAELLPFVGHLHPAAREVFVVARPRCRLLAEAVATRWYGGAPVRGSGASASFWPRRPDQDSPAATRGRPWVRFRTCDGATNEWQMSRPARARIARKFDHHRHQRGEDVRQRRDPTRRDR